MCGLHFFEKIQNLENIFSFLEYSIFPLHTIEHNEAFGPFRDFQIQRNARGNYD